MENEAKSSRAFLATHISRIIFARGYEKWRALRVREALSHMTNAELVEKYLRTTKNKDGRMLRSVGQRKRRANDQSVQIMELAIEAVKENVAG